MPNAVPLPVSVIIPFHNAQFTFDEALASVRDQIDRPGEVIVVDDGSDAEAREFLDARRDEFQLIRLAERRGPGVARNAGVDAAVEPYVAFLDADDRWLPTKLRVQYGFMRSHPGVECTHTGSVVSTEGGWEFARVNHRPRELTLAEALTDPQMTTPSVMMARSAFLDLGGFDPAFRCTQDWELQIRMMLAGYQIRFIPLPLTWIRRQNHGHHSADWRCYLAGHLRVLVKHRGRYVRQWGYRHWLHLLARDLARGGQKQGGWFGRGLRLPYRLGV